MVTRADVDVRFANVGDAEPIAALHADSWRYHYRGAYSAHYLDGDLHGERLAVWTERLDEVRVDQFTLVAGSADRVVGFAHVVLDAHPTWGALVENLHVGRTLQRAGLGTRLLAVAAQIVIDRRPTSPLYLWVQEQNTTAQAFYAARHGRSGDRAPITLPAGDQRNLDGHPFKLRVSWRDPAALLLPS